MQVFVLTVSVFRNKIKVTIFSGGFSMIRFAKASDLPQILEIYSPYVLHTAVSFEYTVPSLEEFTQRFQDITQQFPWLVWEENGKILGYAYGSLPFSRAAYRWCAASSIYLASNAHGKGIGRKLYTALEELLRRQGYRKTYAIITSDNPGSLRFHEKTGFRFIAEFPDCGFKFGKVYSVVWMEKLLNPEEIPQDFPKPVEQIVNVDSFTL